MGEYIKQVYSRMNKVVFFICLGVSLFLLVTAFFVPPTAEISAGVLGGVGEIFGFSALATVIDAIQRGSDIKLQKGDTTIHIDNPDKEENNDK